ncbi:hypothetical protein [Streptomyces sp. NPDC059787]|uniref:hypothetical protein n=1 Tax=Streptomyces sp. NPDC059787 TaxID=3346947 RepID=UPI00366448FC
MTSVSMIIMHNGAALLSVTLGHQFPVPATEAYLLLTSCAPLVRIADAAHEFLDAVAGSLNWMNGDSTHE